MSKNLLCTKKALERYQNLSKEKKEKNDKLSLFECITCSSSLSKEKIKIYTP